MRLASHHQRGFVAALLHRLSGIALAIFLPLHFITLAGALTNASALDGFLAATNNWPVKFAEAGLVGALATHMALGLRVLAIEFFDLRETSAAVLSGCAGLGIGAGVLFLLNAG
jgi:fumarate reductase subunit D